MGKISKNAIIEDGAFIDEDVVIEDGCFISRNATILKGTNIAHGARVEGRTKIGKNNKIYSYAILGSHPQSLKYNDEETELIIGDNNTIREFCTISKGTPDFGGKTIIGDNNFIMTYAHIAHDCKIGDGNIFANNATLAGHVEIGNHTNVGGLTPIHQFVKIGDFCMIAGASAISQDIPHYCIAEGNRAKIRGINRYALRKHFKRAEIDEISSLYKRLFSGDRPIRDIAKDEIEKSGGREHLDRVCRFILDTKRGIPYKRGGNEY